MVVELRDENFKKLIEKGVTFVDFYATWCGPCKAMMPIINSIEEELGDKVNFIKVDVNEHEDLAMEYRISSIPRFFIFKDSKPVKMFVGMQEKDTLIGAISECLTA